MILEEITLTHTLLYTLPQPILEYNTANPDHQTRLEFDTTLKVDARIAHPNQLDNACTREAEDITIPSSAKHITYSIGKF